MRLEDLGGQGEQSNLLHSSGNISPGLIDGLHDDLVARHLHDDTVEPVVHEV